MKKFIKLFTALAVVVGVMAVGTSVFADDDTLTVESVAYSSDSAKAEASDAVSIKINGAEQVAWENPNHNEKANMNDVRKAPHITTRCSESNRKTQSQEIFRRTNGAKIVVLEPGSCAWNRGKQDNITVGFRWHVKKPAVLIVKGDRYRHAFDVVNGKLVKTCLNYIGGDVDHYVPSAVQVQYAGDIKAKAQVTALAEVTATVEASRECPGGKVYATASAHASATSSAWAYAKMKYIVKATGDVKSQLLASVKAKVKADAEAEAKARITITCGDAPSTTPAPQLLNIDTINDVLVNNTRVINVSGSVAPNQNGVLLCSASTGSIVSGNRQNVTGHFDTQITYKAGDEPGTDQVTCTLTQDDHQTDQVSTNQFEVRSAPVDPAKIAKSNVQR